MRPLLWTTKKVMISESLDEIEALSAKPYIGSDEPEGEFKVRRRKELARIAELEALIAEVEAAPLMEE